MIQIKRNNKVFFTLEDFGEGSKLSYQLMDHHYIILKFTTDTPIYFEIGDSVEIPDFGYFELTSSYFPKHNDSDGYDYEMQMDAYYMSWKNKLCKYRPQHGANETSFNLTTTVGVHMNVILGNLKALGLTYNGKDFSVDYTTYNNKAFDVQKRFLIEYGSISILDALNAICSEDALNCEWWIDGSIIYLGYCEMEGQTTFEQDVNVLSMSYSESKSTYITRLYAFGSDRNIPKGYFTGADADVTTDGVATDYLMLPNKEVDSDGFYAKDGYLENVNVVKNDKQAIEGVVMFEEEYPKVECMVSSIKTYDSTVDNEDGTKTTQTFWQVTSTDSFTNSFKESWIKSNLTLGIKFTSGALMGMEFDVSFKVIDNVNYFEIVANDTYGRTLPDGVMCPKVGDKYFLFNWDATKITDTDLIPAAQLSLFDRSKQYYQKTMISNSNFTCTMDGEKFFNDGTYDYHPLGEQVKLINDMFAQVDADGKHYRNSRIIGMEIPLDIPYDHPQYIVGEKAATSRLGKLEDKVDSIKVNGMQIGGTGSGNGGGVYVIGMNDTTPASDSNVYSARRSRMEFVSRLQDNTAKGTITWEKVQKFFSGLLVGNPNNENGGSWIPDAEGRSHFITDYLEVRMKAIFEELVIKETSTIGGKEIISPAGGVVAHKVEEVTVTYNNVSQKAYRCYFLAEQEGDSVDNDFAVNDQVRSESFNVRKGTYHKVGNHFYWRLVIGRDEDPVELEGKKYHYIDLSDTDCATASDVPAKGDVLNQCGNRTDVERQNCLIFSAVDNYSPSISLYHGINSYSFANREYVEYGVNKQNNKAFFNVYGDMYVGDRPTKENGYEGSSYIKYDSAAKQVSIKGKLSAKSTVDGKELSQYIKENSAKGLTEEQVNNLIKNSQVIADLQNQVDGAIETWFYDGVPTLKNAPASSWTTDKEKDTHLGDLYYDNKTGKAYRFAKDGNTYKWTIITDTDIAKALSDASKAQETADGKMKVFSTQPTPPYQVGDIWVNATYPTDGSTYKNEVLRCQTAKGAGSQFAIGDWIKASKYTDDTVANAAKAAAEKAQKAAEKAQGDISKLGTTVTTNKKAFDSYVTDGYLEPSEIAAMAQDSKRLEDDFAAAQKSYNEVKEAEVLANTNELIDLKTAFDTLTTAKTELIKYLSDISKRYNASDTNGKAIIVSAVGTKFTNFQSAYSAFYDKLGLANAYITSKIYGDLKQNITDLAGYKYLKDALGQTTDIDGGLVMTTLLALRDADGNVQSGINGAIDQNRGKKSIATWWGGQMVDKDYNSGNLTPATSLIRFDGSGYLASGAIWWDVSGKVHADPTSFIISEKNLGAYLTFFEPTWKAGSAGTSVADLVSLKPNAPFTKLGVSGDATFEGAISFHGIKLTYDATNKAIKIDGNLYATGGISAYGASDATSGGGGLNGSVKSYADALKLTSESLSEVASAYSIKALSRRIDNIATELGGLNLSWNNITGKPSTFTPSAHTHKWADITDRITKVSQLTNDAGYLTAHQSLASYYTKSSVDSLLSGKSATSHTHSVKINGVTKTIAATGGTAVDLGTYLTSHQTIYGLTIQKNGTSLGTYTPNSAAKTINVTVPTKLSELSNDSGYTKNTGTVTSVAISVPTGLSVSGSPITTNGTIAIALASGYSIPTTAKQTAWDGAVSAKHTHSNKSVLDGITSTKVTCWDSAYDWYALITTDEETADGVINKWNEVVSFLANIAQTDTLSGIVDGINKSISDEVARAKKAEGVNASGISANKGSIATLQGYFTNGSAKKAIQLTNARKLWGNSFNGTADINGSIIVPSGKYISIGNIKLEYDAANKALKITNTTTNEVANLYTSGGVSAYGVGTSSSSGGGLNGSVKSYSNALKLTSESLSEVASAYSIKALDSRISSLEGGSAMDVSVSGSGNAVTAISKSGTTIIVTKGTTFLTSHQSLASYLTKTDAASLYQPKGNYLTAHQSLDGYVNAIAVSGSGNAVTAVTKSGKTITFTKGSTFSLNGHTHTFASLTSKPTSLSGYGITDGVNAVSVTGSGNAVTAASVSGHTLTLTKGSTFSLSNHTHYVGTTRVQGSSAEQALTGITKIDNILKLSKASVTVNTSYKAEQNRLVIYGSTYGNDANYIKSAGKLSYGDGGPQLVFSTGENPDASGVQSAALVYTDNDTIGAGVSLSFVTNQGDAYFIAPHIKALTAFQGNLAWSYITNKPTTLSGFGITDGLRSVTQPSGSNVFVTGISTNGTAITYTKSYTKKSLSAVGTSGWTNASIDGNIIPDMNFIAYWNGAYSGTRSNLAYCNKGAFGSFAIKNSLAFSELTSKPTTISGYGITDAYTKSQVDAIAAKYLPLTGGTLTGQLKIVASALNGAYNGLRIGDDCYIGDCNIGNTIGLMGVSNNNAGMVKFGKGGMQFGYNGSNHIASTTAQWTNLNADLLDGWHKDNIVWSGAVNSNTASLSHYWAKLFDITVTDNRYDDRSFTFLFSNGYNDTYSVVVLKIRQNGAKDSGAYNFSISLRELVGNMSSRLRVYYNNATGNVQLWGNCQGQYGSLSYTIIKKTGRTSADFTSQGTLVTNTSFSAAQSFPATTGDSPYTLLDGATRIGIVKQADQLVTARSLWGQSFNGTANVSGNMTGVGNINTSAAPAGTIYTNNWFRSKGSTGWYSEDHGGGWYMSDNTWIRNFGGKDVYLSNKLCVNSNVGIGTTAPSHKLHVSGEIYTTTKVNINGIILEKDSNGDLKVNGNLYATGGISAYGTSSAGSGGGLSGSVLAWDSAIKMPNATNGSSDTTKTESSFLASAWSIKQLYNKVTSLEGGSAMNVSVSGSGNAVTSISKSGTTISVVKGSTFLTAHQSLANYYTKSSVDSLLSGKSATTHTHSVKINGITKTIAASGGDAVDLGTYLTAHQSLAAYATQNWVKNEATAHNANMVDNYHASGLFTGFSISDVANKVTISIGGTSKALNLVRAFPSGVGNNFNDIATHGNSMGMSNIAAPYASSTANYQTLNGYVNPNGQTGWHHYINLSYTDSNNTATSPNMWQTQFAIKAGTTEVYVRSRAGGKISNDAAWAAPWVRLARVTDNVASASKVVNALSWSGYSSGSYNGSAVKSISIPNNTNQLTNGAGFITASASITGNAATATKVNHSLSVFGKSFNGSADVTVADTDLIASILTATANLTDKTEILTSYASNNGFNDSNSKNRIYRRPASAIWGYINSKTISNADKLDNVHLNGIFTALSNTNNGVSMTIGTVAKSLANMQVYSATKLVTARNIALNGDFTGNANFDGSANITINGYMSYCNAIVGNTNTYPWRRIAKVNEITGNYSDGCILLYISEGFIGGCYGIARVYIRTDNLSTGANASCSIQWISRNGYGLDSLKIAMYKTTGKAYYDVFLKMRGMHASVVIRTLQDQRGGLGKRFTLVNSTETTNAASHTEAYATIEDAATAIHNKAYTSIAQGSDVATVHNADMVDGIHVSGLFTNLSNSGNSLSITVGGTNKTLTVNYASNAGNADTVDGVHASGLFTNLSNSGNNISITIGGTNKTLTAAYATNCDTVDGYHAQLGSSKPYGKIPVIGTDGVIELGHYIDFHHDNTTGSDYSVRLQTNGNHSNVVTLPTATGTLALTSGNVASATKLQTARTIWGQSFNGTANVSGALSGATTISASNTISTTLQNGALKIGNKSTPISAIDAQVIFNTGAAIRFGETAWDWNLWAGLKYNHSKKTIYLGIADGSVFNANAAQSGGSLYFPGINDVNCYDSFRIVGGSADINGTVYSYYTTYGKDSITCTFGIMAPSNTIYLNDNSNGITLSSYAGVNLNSNTGHEIILNASTSVLMKTNNGVIIKSNSSVALNVNGNLLATGGVTAYSSSDIRLKTDLRKLDYLGIIKAMGGTFGFAWKKDNTRSIGWIAQHVLCNPHLKDIVETDEKGYYKINYWSPKLIAVAFGAIEQVDDEVAKLKARVRELENEVEQLKSDRL